MSSSVHSTGTLDGSVAVRLLFKEEKDAVSAIKQFNGETADGRTLSVKSVGNQPVNLAARLDGMLSGDGSVDALLPSSGSSSCVNSSHINFNFILRQIHRKMRSDDVLAQDPRASVMITPPGGDPKDYEVPQAWSRGGRGRGRGRGRPSRGARRGSSNGGAQMDIDR